MDDFVVDDGKSSEDDPVEYLVALDRRKVPKEDGVAEKKTLGSALRRRNEPSVVRRRGKKQSFHDPDPWEVTESVEEEPIRAKKSAFKST